MDLSRRVAMVLGAALVAGVACQDMATAPRSSPARPSSFDVGPSTYGALWALTDAGFVLRHTVTPAGPVPPDAVDSARAGALRATFQGFASTHTLMSSSAPGSASGIGQANGANQARTRRAMRMTRLSLGKVDNKALMIGLVPGEGEDAPLAAIVISSDNQAHAPGEREMAARTVPHDDLQQGPEGRRRAGSVVRGPRVLVRIARGFRRPHETFRLPRPS